MIYRKTVETVCLVLYPSSIKESTERIYFEIFNKDGM
jgi:hypothetical protein